MTFAAGVAGTGAATHWEGVSAWLQGELGRKVEEYILHTLSRS